MKEKLKKVFQLFITFIKIGAFTFGGGYAMVPLIQRETVEKKKWINDDDILEIVAIAESTPGPIAVNSATFVGYKTAGVLGAAAATIGVVLPSFTIIYFISFVIDKFEENIFQSFLTILQDYYSLSFSLNILFLPLTLLFLANRQSICRYQSIPELKFPHSI